MNSPISLLTPGYLQRLSDLIGPYRGTYRIVYRVLQPLLVIGMVVASCSAIQHQVTRRFRPPRWVAYRAACRDLLGPGRN